MRCVGFGWGGTTAGQPGRPQRAPEAGMRRQGTGGGTDVGKARTSEMVCWFAAPCACAMCRWIRSGRKRICRQIQRQLCWCYCGRNGAGAAARPCELVLSVAPENWVRRAALVHATAVDAGSVNVTLSRMQWPCGITSHYLFVRYGSCRSMSHGTLEES